MVWITNFFEINFTRTEKLVGKKNIEITVGKNRVGDYVHFN